MGYSAGEGKMDNMVVTAAKMVQSEEKKSVVLVLDFGSQYTHLII